MNLDLTIAELGHLWKALEHYGQFHGELMKSVQDQVTAQAPPKVEPAVE